MALFILFRPFLVSWSLYFKSQFYRARFAFFQIRSALENWDGGTFKSSEYTDFPLFFFPLLSANSRIIIIYAIFFWNFVRTRRIVNLTYFFN